MENIQQPILMSEREVARTKLMSHYAVRKGVAAGTIPTVTVGKRKKVNYSRLIQMLEEQTR